jgi:hypothetical protein
VWDRSTDKSLGLSQVLHIQETYNAEPTKEQKIQLLADALVWAEISQEHYDPTTLE